MLQNIDKKFSFRPCHCNCIYHPRQRIQRQSTHAIIYLNTYAYITFMTVWIVACNLYLIDYVKSNPESNKNNKPGSTLLLVLSPINMIILFVLSLVLLYKLISTQSEQTFRKHSILLLFLSVFSIFTVPLTERIQQKNPQSLAQLTTTFFSIVISASIFAFSFPNMIKTCDFRPFNRTNWNYHRQNHNIILGYSKNSQESQSLSTFSAIVFSFFIAYDTNCRRGC